MIDKNARSYNEKPVFIFSGIKISWEKLKCYIDELEPLCLRNKLSRKTPILLDIENDLDLAICMASLLYFEIPALCLPRGTKKIRVAEMLKDFPFFGIVTTEKNFAEKNESVKLSSGEEIALFISEENHSDEELDFHWLLHTSGSTGASKIVMLGEENLFERTMGEIELFKIESHFLLLNILSFSHDLGLNQLLTTLCSGATLEIFSKKLPYDLFMRIEKGGLDGITGMPQIWQQMISIAKNLKIESSYSGYMTISGGSMHEKDLILLRNFFNKAKIIKTYGQTETFRSLAETRQEKSNFYQSGLPLPSVQCFLINEQGKLCKDDEEGELVHVGAGSMLGYWKDEGLTKQKIRSIKNFFPERESLVSTDGIFTGDFFKKLPEGEYEYLGRKDDMVKYSGHRFFLNEIENCLMRSHLVGSACVLLTLDSAEVLMKEKIIAWVVLNRKKINAEAFLRQYCIENLERFKIPAQIVVLDEFPLTLNGKIDRLKLRMIK